jgi:microcystin-dependent protein
MTAPFVGEIRMFGCNFAPRNYVFCNGQLMPIAQNTALFSLLGTTFGGNGTTNFALPNLQGRAPVGFGPGPGPGLTQRELGEFGGSEGVTLLQTEMPAHNHGVSAQSSRADRANASGAALAASADQVYATGSPAAVMSPQEIGLAGGNQPHNNLQPFLAINFCIALFGIYPARN